PDPLPPPARADLAAQDLRFCYAPDDPPALDGVSFTLPQGGTLAIVGASGAGKSTLVNLLLRFWDYGEGTITLGGQDLRCYRQDDVRAQFAVVRQDTHLFSGTIRDNLRLAQPEAPEQDLIAAARRAQIVDRKSTRLNSSHVKISYAVFCLKKKKPRAGRDLWAHETDARATRLRRSQL